jgi:hypothetical protein
MRRIVGIYAEPRLGLGAAQAGTSAGAAAPGRTDLDCAIATSADWLPGIMIYYERETTML